MSRQFTHRYALPSDLLDETSDAALRRHLDAAEVSLGSRQRIHGTITDAGEAVYLFTANRTKARRLAARMDATLQAKGRLSYLCLPLLTRTASTPSSSPSADNRFCR